MAETGQSWWAASSVPCTRLLPAVLRRLPDQDAPCGERRGPGGMKRCQICVWKSRGLLRLSDMCQKSPGLESCQLRLKPRRALGCQLRLQLRALHTEVDRSAPRALIYCWVCQMYATGGEIWARECATHHELQRNQQRLRLASRNKRLSNMCWLNVKTRCFSLPSLGFRQVEQKKHYIVTIELTVLTIKLLGCRRPCTD